ncbi:MAG: glycosyltransferase family 4 protein [Nitrosopumilaceae archaeon]
MKKICVFPNDPLISYFKKGEIKSRYFNPKNMFDEVHVISLFDDDIKEEEVKDVAGNAYFKIHVVGKVNLVNKNSKKKKIIELIKEIKPDILRAYNPLLQGWMAVQVKKKLDIPLVISLHGDYDRDRRYFSRKNKDYKTYLKLLYTKKTLEPISLKNADKIIIIYDFIRNYAEKMGGKDINLIYNRINLSQFSPEVKPIFKESKPVIICVGRLIKEKNQECLIKAIKDLDVILLIIGNGLEYDNLVKLTRDLGIEEKVRFETSIPNERIQEYYASATIFALPIKYGGFAIPALEAAASGLPVVLPQQEFDPNPDIIKEFALLVKNNPDSFKDAISKIISDEKLQKKMIQDGLDIAKKINSDVMEEKEKDLYLKLLEKN